MSSICIIPARGGSRRIPKKNIREFHGKPIIAYSIEVGREVFGRVAVSTDDAEIETIAIDYGAEVIPRSKWLAGDNVGTQWVTREALRYAGVGHDCMTCCLYPAAPMVRAADLDEGWRQVIRDARDYAVGVYPDRIQDAGAFYIGPAWSFLVDKPLSSTNTAIIPFSGAIDINTEDDWAKAERMYAARRGME